MNKFLIRIGFGLIWSIFFMFNIHAQEIGHAINISHNGDPENKVLHSKLLEKLEKRGLKNYVIYDWKYNKLKLNTKTKFEERPARLALFLKQNVWHSDRYKPEIKTTVDTNGVVNAAWFVTNYNTCYSLRSVDIKSGIVEDIGNLCPDPNPSSKYSKTVSSIPNKKLTISIKKYFGRRKLSSIKNYSKLKVKIYKDYKEEIEEKFLSNRAHFIGKLSNVVSNINNFLDRTIFDVTIKDRNAKKIKEVTLKGGSNHRVGKNETFDVYAYVKEGDIEYAKYVTFITAKEISKEETLCKKSFIQSRKKFTRRLKEHEKMFGVRKRRLAKMIVPTKEEDIIYLSLKMDENKSTNSFERRIICFPAIRLIERNFENELNYLRSIYKDERFMDYDLGDLQDRLVGAQYLLTIENDNVSVTDVATGKVVSIDQKEGKKYWLLKGYSVIQSVNLALIKITGKSITYMKTVSEKKNKVKEIQLYHPFGFEMHDEIDISIIKQEVVAGKTYDRKEFLAKGLVKIEKESPNIGVLKIKRKYRKEVFKALQGKEQLDFIYSIKRED